MPKCAVFAIPAAEFGDYDDQKHTDEFLSDYIFLPPVSHMSIVYSTLSIGFIKLIHNLSPHSLHSISVPHLCFKI